MMAKKNKLLTRINSRKYWSSSTGITSAYAVKVYNVYGPFIPKNILFEDSNFYEPANRIIKSGLT